MATLTAEQIEQKKQLLAEKVKQMKAIYDELVEAGAWPLSDSTRQQEEFLARGGDLLNSGKIRFQMNPPSFPLISK